MSLDPRPVLRRSSPGRILACLAAVLFALLVGAGSAAQSKAARGKSSAAQEQASEAKKKKKGKKADAGQEPGSAAQPLPTVSTTRRPAVDKKQRAKQARQSWKQVTKSLFVECLARNPELAYERPWPGLAERHLGNSGSGATLRWRKTLADALVVLHKIGEAEMPWQARAQLGALEDWIEAELLLLEARMPSTSDPAAYVQRAFRTLRAAREAPWMTAEQRTTELARLLRELPACFRDARISLIDPASQWIDLALLDLDDLQDLVGAIAAELPRPKKGAADTELDARAALDLFRAWLLDLRPSAGARPPLLNESEWQRLVRLRSGTSWSVSEIKTRCLRELARLDLAARAEPPGSPRRDDGEDPARLAASASARALLLATDAKILQFKRATNASEFVLETSPRGRPEIARLRQGEDGSACVLLARPHGSWPAERTITRNTSLQQSARALGLRYGVVGEGLFTLRGRAGKKATSVLFDDHLMREGFGLFALDWASRVDWEENPFRADEELARELQYQLGYEAARLVAALELHAEGLSLDGAALSFQRRTGVDADTALVEALAAQRDPLHGIGYVGLIELRALEQRLTKLAKPRAALKLCLLAARYPDLRPADLAPQTSRGPMQARKRQEKSALENPGGSQQEQPRSR